LTFGTNNTERMRLDASGNLGIGTSSPGTRLSVQGVSVGALLPLLRLHNADSTDGTGAAIDFSTNSTFVTTGRIAGVREGTGLHGLQFSTFGAGGGPLSEVMRLSAAGNLGLGVTPSGWGSNYRAMQLGAGANEGGISGQSNANILSLISNGYNNGTNWIYGNSIGSGLYQLEQNTHKWFTAPSGTAGNAISFTQAMTLNASGQLSVGTTSASAKITIGGSGANRISFDAPSGSEYVGYDGADDALQVASYTYIKFQTGSSYTERARITSGGDFGIGLAPSGSYKLEVNGTAAATDFNSTSDRNKKTNIATITDALDKVQALRGVTFDWIADGKASTGLIAQEVEQVMPQVVQGDEGNKTVSYGSLVGLLIEAVKELTARVAQLEGK
jgi:hypothetical protein